MYRTRVDEYKRELARVDENMSALANQYVTGRLRATAAARRPRQSTAATAQWDASEAAASAYGDAGVDFGGSPSRQGGGGGGMRVPTAQAAAVKDEADELLQAYAHVLGTGDDARAGETKAD